LAIQRDNRWRIALIPSDSGIPRFVDPEDGANRFDPSWLGATALVVVSDRDGAPNLERIDFGGTAAPIARPITRVTGAAIAPEPNANDGSIWFLWLHSRGYDVRRLVTPSPLADEKPTPLLDSKLPPVVVKPTTFVRVFSPAKTSPPESYGWGPRTTRWLPAASIGTTGREATLALLNTDVVGRLSVLALGALGSGDAWRGGSIEGVWRGDRPELRLSGFIERSDSRSLEVPFGQTTSTELRGGYASIDFTRSFDTWSARLTTGGSPEWLTQRASRAVQVGVGRYLGYGELRAQFRQTSEVIDLAESLTAHGSIGSTGDTSYDRELVSAGLHISVHTLLPLDLSGAFGRVSANAPSFEQFTIGGLPSTLTPAALLSQRVTMPALPATVGTGEQILTYRAATTLAGLTPYWWSASTRSGDARFATWHRVFGVDFDLYQSPVAVLGTPGARLLVGLARSLDAPFAQETRAYGVITLRP
jgi:hypothetical protein